MCIMTKREMKILDCECRIELLMARPKDNGRIVKKLQRKLRQLKKEG